MATQTKNDSRTTLFSTQIDIEKKTRDQLIQLLNEQLADTFDMYSQVKQAHWNVKGPQFFQLHELYDLIAEGLLPYVDMIAERATALGGLAKGTVRMAGQSTRLQDYPLDAVEDLHTVEVLAGCMAKLAKSTREAADKAESLEDMSTNDLFIEISRDLDKWLWFLEAHLQNPKG